MTVQPSQEYHSPHSMANKMDIIYQEYKTNSAGQFSRCLSYTHFDMPIIDHYDHTYGNKLYPYEL